MRSGAKQFEKKIAAKNSILNIILTLINHQIKSQVIFLEKTSFLLNIFFLGKPNSQHDTADGEEDAEFLNIIHKVRVEPRKKYSEPITETQVKSYETSTYQKRTICTKLVLFLGIWLVLGSPSKRQLERPSSSICDY